jgi:hypothetical protein
MTSQQASAPLDPAADGVAVLFRARYLEMVRLAGLLEPTIRRMSPRRRSPA